MDDPAAVVRLADHLIELARLPDNAIRCRNSADRTIAHGIALLCRILPMYDALSRETITWGWFGSPVWPELPAVARKVVDPAERVLALDWMGRLRMVSAALRFDPARVSCPPTAPQVEALLGGCLHPAYLDARRGHRLVPRRTDRTG
jgi:hypothetical protein